MAVFDTLRAARTLKAAGFGGAQAEAVAEIVQAVANGNRVSKADFERFASTLDLERFTTKAEFEAFARTLHLERFATKEDLQDLELRLTIRMGVIAASAVTIGVALMVALNQLLL